MIFFGWLDWVGGMHQRGIAPDREQPVAGSAPIASPSDHDHPPAPGFEVSQLKDARNRSQYSHSSADDSREYMSGNIGSAFRDSEIELDLWERNHGADAAVFRAADQAGP